MRTAILLALATVFVLYRLANFLLLRRKDASLEAIDTDFASRLEQKEESP
ncbi:MULTISPECIES: hypothetical protein [Paenibacillus]|nr:hypothetical protein [Paenibacillus caseinilyticus]MCZ8522588.1 hypothetical protein [Paenibacillus caseinilyticus]